MAVNPIFGKDLRGLLRLKRLAAIQVAYVLGLIALVTSAPAAKGNALLAGLVLGQLGLLLLVVPALGSVSLTVEKEEQTLEMLTSSRMSAWQIIFGKALSAAAFPVILIVSGFPFVFFVAHRLGLEPAELGSIYLILFLAALMTVMVCLTASAFCRDSATALVLGYLLTLLLTGGVIAPAAAGVETALTHHIGALSPVAAELSILRPDLPEDFSGLAHARAPAHLLFIPLSLAVIVVCVGLAVIRLDRPVLEGQPPLSPALWTGRIFAGLLIVSLMVAALGRQGLTQEPARLTRLAQFLVILQIGAAAALSTGIGAAAISTEIERGTFEMLRASRLSVDWIFWSKLLPAILCGLMTIPAMMPAYATILYFSPEYTIYFLRLIPLAVGTAVLGSVMGLACSCFFVTTARATVTAFSAMACLFIIPLAARLGEQGGILYLGDWTDRAILTSPLLIGLGLHPHAQQVIEETWPRHLLWLLTFSLCLLSTARLRFGMRMRKG